MMIDEPGDLHEKHIKHIDPRVKWSIDGKQVTEKTDCAERTVFLFKPFHPQGSGMRKTWGICIPALLPYDMCFVVVR